MTIYIEGVGGGNPPAKIVIASSDAVHPERANYICDGINDHVEIQAAVDSFSTIGGDIYLTEGAFNIGDEIDVEVPIDWHGAGAGEHWSGALPQQYYGTLLSANAGLTTRMIHIHGEHYAGAFYDLGFSGANMSQSVLAPAQSAIDIENRGDFLVSHCFIMNLPFGTALYMHNHGSWIVGCDFEYNRLVTTGAIHLQAHRNWVDKCYFSNNRSAIELGTGEMNVFNNVFVSSNRYHIANDGLEKVSISNNRFKTWNTDASTYNAVYFYSDSIVHHQISHNVFDGDSCGATRAISDTGHTVDYISILGNDFHGFGTTAPVLMTSAGPNCVIRDNIGYITEKSGIATLASGTTSIVVTHGLSVTPTAGDIVVTPIEAWGSMTQFYIDTYTATQFTIHADQNPTQDVDFAWKAVVL